MTKQRRRCIIVLAVLVAHGAWVSLVAYAVRVVVSRGEEGYILWWAVGRPDYPVVLLGRVLQSFLRPHYALEDVFFWNHTFTYWEFMIGGSLQWALILWVFFWIRDRLAERKAVR